MVRRVGRLASWRRGRRGGLEIALEPADTYRVIARLQSPFRAAHRTAFGGKPADSDETPVRTGEPEVLVDGLAGPQDGTSPLIGWLAERDVLLQQKEHDPEGAEGETTLAVTYVDDDDRTTREREEFGSAPAERHLQPVDGEPALAHAGGGPGEPEAAPAGTDAPVRDADATLLGHLRFAPFPDGYRLVASDERCAVPGDVVELDERLFVVTRVGRSPLPADVRPCAFLASTLA